MKPAMIAGFVFTPFYVDVVLFATFIKINIMPKFQDKMSLPGTDKNKTLAVAYQTFYTLGWTVMFAGEAQLVGATAKNWKSKGQQILVQSDTSEVAVQSKMVSGESFDLGGINKKNVAAFSVAFQNIYQSISPEEIAANVIAIDQLKQDTIVAAEKEIKKAELVDKAMNLSGSNLYITYGIIAINILVFTLMVFDGAGIMETNTLIHIKWGANYGPLTLSGDYWRLLTSTFIHFGIIHVLMNMYCLYTIGIYLEPMLGKVKYITAYLATGILASVVSLWWHTEPTVSAGASGAVFGMYGLFLALLTTDLIPKSVRDALLKSIGIFIIYNLAYGMKSGVDNSAHVGGLVSGFVLGYLYVIAIRAGKKDIQTKWVIPAIVVVTFGISFAFLDQHKSPVADRKKILSEVKEGSFKDDDKFNQNYNDFVESQNVALKVFSDTTLDNAGMKKALTAFAVPEWDKAEVKMKAAQFMDISPAKKKKTDIVLQYIDLRKQEIAAAFKVLDKTENAQAGLDSVREKINTIIVSLQ